MSARLHDLKALKSVGIIQQRQKNLFAMRLHVVGGDLTGDQLRKIAEVAIRYGGGMLHLSTRQGIEIHNMRYEDIEPAREELASVKIKIKWSPLGFACNREVFAWADEGAIQIVALPSLPAN